MTQENQEKDEPVIGLDKMGEPIIDPAPDKPPTWEDTVPAKALFRGGSWGMGFGIFAAIIYGDNHSVLGGIYAGPGNLTVVLLIGAGAGFVAGALVGWLSAEITGKNILPRSSPFDED